MIQENPFAANHTERKRQSQKKLIELAALKVSQKTENSSEFTLCQKQVLSKISKLVGKHLLKELLLPFPFPRADKLLGKLHQTKFFMSSSFPMYVEVE